MADILFITPTTKTDKVQEEVGTLLLATILLRNGLQAKIFPFTKFGDPEDFQAFLNAAMSKIKAEKPKIVSFYTRCDCYHIMLKMAQQIKSEMDVYVVLGGPQADISAVETLSRIPYVDFVCCGEGESTIYPFFSSLLRREPDLRIAGLVWRDKDQIVKNPRPTLVENLDDLPHIDYEAFGVKPVASNDAPFPIDVGRGCPFGCTYCSTKSFWGRKYRLKSPQRIVEEIKTLHDRYGITYFIFEHDMFTMDRKQVLETCRLLRDLDFPVTWSCSARLDCLDETLIDCMTGAGMRRIFIGIETGSARMQKIINKNLKLDRAIPIVQYLCSKNIEIITSFIYGFPEETDDDISQTLALWGKLVSLPNVKAPAYLCTFLPGTELSIRYQRELVPSAQYSGITGAVAVAECADIINGNPTLFWHFHEYRTELRTRLTYLPVFLNMWTAVQPIYRYLSEKYPEGNFIDMYSDFVRANRDLLEKGKDLQMRQQIYALLCDDKFADLCRGDGYDDIIKEVYRVSATKHSQALKKTEKIIDLFGVNPLDVGAGTQLQDIKRQLCKVEFIMSDSGKQTLRIQKLR